MGPNVEMIRSEGIRVVRGTIPRQVRSELMAGVKAGELGRMRKDGLMPEVFFDPDLRDAAEAKRREIAIDAAGRIGAVLA